MDNTKLKALQSSINDLHEQIKTESQKSFKEAVQELFEKYPGLKTFSWNQYTPYFCDGDPCHFHVNDWSIKINGGPTEYDEESAIAWYDDAEKDVRSILNAINDSVFETMFGDHCEVTVSKNDITVEEYSHD